MAENEISSVVKSLSDAIKADKDNALAVLLQQLRQSIIYEVAKTNAASDNNGLATDNELTTAITSLTSSINSLQTAVTNLTTRITDLESSAIRVDTVSES